MSAEHDKLAARERELVDKRADQDAEMATLNTKMKELKQRVKSTKQDLKRVRGLYKGLQSKYDRRVEIESKRAQVIGQMAKDCLNALHETR